MGSDDLPGLQAWLCRGLSSGDELPRFLSFAFHVVRGWHLPHRTVDMRMKSKCQGFRQGLVHTVCTASE